MELELEYHVLLIACCLGLTHIACASFAFKRQVGHAYTIGPRDDALTPIGLAGRLQRAQTNFFETFPIFLALIFMLAQLQEFDQFSQWGRMIYLIGRLMFLPLYAFGVVLYRTLAWKIATTGIALMVISIFV